MTKKLTILSLTLITVGSVDSIRNLPAAALVGSNLFLYFTLALFFFLLPSAVVSCWFSSQSDQGIYGWVKKSLGAELGYIAIWFQWMQNILIYPTFFSFIAGAFLYCIDPRLTQQKEILFVIINCFIWSLTWINIRGLQLAHKLTVFCSFVGLVIPFALILIIGLVCFFSSSSLLLLKTPVHQDTWTSLTAIILSFCGIEIAAVHAQDSQRGAYPKAIAISVFIIFATMLFGSLTLAIMLTPQQLNFITGIPELFHVFFTQIKWEKMSLLINALIVIGCIGCANSWLIAPVRGLLYANRDLDSVSTDNKNMSKKLLLIQAGGVSLISTLFLWLPSINSSYWVMMTLATQMYLLMYLLMFIGAVKLSWTTKNKLRWLIFIMSMLGLIGISIALVVSFSFPSSLQYGSPQHYFVFLITCLLLMTASSILGKKMFGGGHA